VIAKSCKKILVDYFQDGLDCPSLLQFRTGPKGKDKDGYS
jgi:hypothetical protein